jgi:hypothetical protein
MLFLLFFSLWVWHLFLHGLHFNHFYHRSALLVPALEWDIVFVLSIYVYVHVFVSLCVFVNVSLTFQNLGPPGCKPVYYPSLVLVYSHFMKVTCTLNTCVLLRFIFPPHINCKYVEFSWEKCGFQLMVIFFFILNVEAMGSSSKRANESVQWLICVLMVLIVKL